MGKYQVHQLDSNQAEIVAALEACGFTVEPLGRPVDVAAGKQGQTFLIEIKRPTAKLRASQLDFIARWRGHVCVLRSVDDVQRFARDPHLFRAT